MKNRIITFAAVGLLGAAAFAHAAPSMAAPTAADYSAQASKALTWIKTQQQPDGSFAGFGAGSTIDAVLAIISGHSDPATYTQGGNSPVTFLESKAAGLAAVPGGAGKLAYLAETIGADAHSFGGLDLVDSINATYGISATGQYGPDAIGHAFSILGLHAAGESVPDEALTRLKALQGPDGGWAFTGDTAPGSADTNTTSVVVQAMVALGADKAEADVASRAASYLVSQQNTDGGWPYQQGSEFGSDSDVNSTSYVVQALLSLGNTTEAAEGQAWIASLQNASGAFPFMKSDPTDNAGATYQAIPALYAATFVSPTAPTVSAPTTQPGMPTTGTPYDWVYMAALLAFAALVSVAGLALRRAS